MLFRCLHIVIRCCWFIVTYGGMSTWRRDGAEGSRPAYGVTVVTRWLVVKVHVRWRLAARCRFARPVGCVGIATSVVHY